jgi:hypothetical protein
MKMPEVRMVSTCGLMKMEEERLSNMLHNEYHQKEGSRQT